MGLARMAAHPNPFKSADLVVINQMRAELLQAPRAGPASNPGEIRLSPEMIRSWGRRYPHPHPHSIRAAVFGMFGVMRTSRQRV